MVVIARSGRFAIGFGLCGFALIGRHGLSDGLYDKVYDLRVRGRPMHVITARTLAPRDGHDDRRSALVCLQKVFASQALHPSMHLHHSV